MEHLFLSVVNRSLAACLLVVAIVVLRLFLKRAPKALFCVLWGFVAVRLIFPISWESPFSLIPSALTVPDTMLSDSGSVHRSNDTALRPPVADEPVESGPGSFSPVGTVNTLPSFRETALTKETELPDSAQNGLPVTDAASFSEKRPLLHDIFLVASVVWPVGILGMLLYAVISYLRIYKKVKEAVPLYDTIWVCDHVETPFILGIFKPRILLPSSIQPVEMQHVIAHEKAHLKRLDHLWKPLGYVLLSVYWFNPVLWIAYLFLCKDIELACDEQVIRRMSPEDIKSYSSTLLNYSVSKKLISVCPLAFGEVNVKKRIKNALNYKKPAFWIIAVAVISCAVMAVCFLSNPVHSESGKEAEQNGEIIFLSMTQSETGSDIPGIRLSTEPYTFFTADKLGDMSLQVQWINDNYNADFLYGDSFDILYCENDTRNSCAAEEFTFCAIAHVLPKKSEETVTYSLNGFDFSKEGLYRFQTEPATGQYLWFDFEVAIARKEDPASLSSSALLSIVTALSKDRTEINSILSENPELYDLLLSGGDNTVSCFVNELNKTKSYGIREYLMAHICSRLTGIGLEEGEYDPDTWWATADQWLEIYKKHLAEQSTVTNTSASSSGAPTDTARITGTYAEWKVSKDLTPASHPKTPVPRSLVWVNYNYNPKKNPGGIIKIELPEFPGVTFYADSQKIYAYTSEGRQTLIRGETIWTTYLADLNNDNCPEFCATISSEWDNRALEIMIYDFANKKTYGISDLKQYNYALFGDYDSMYVQKMDRDINETVLVGKLSIAGSPDNGTALELTEVPDALYRSVYVPGSMLDLLGYSNLYGDYATGKNRWSSNDYCTLCDIDTPEDRDNFLSAYSDVRLWTKAGVYSLTDDFVKENVLSPDPYSMEGFHSTIVLTTHGLTEGWYRLLIPEEA